MNGLSASTAIPLPHQSEMTGDFCTSESERESVKENAGMPTKSVGHQRFRL
jgi:hypothetical protein